MIFNNFSALDYCLAVFLIFSIFKGWRRGLIGTAFSIAGTIGGAILGHYIINNLSAAHSSTTVYRWGVQAFVLLVAISLGSSFGSTIGKRVNKALGWKPFQLLDQILGATLSLLGWTIAFWIVATTILVLPVTSITSQVSKSEVIKFIDREIPANIRTMIDNFRGIASQPVDETAPRF
jgi:uncharacterized membrane protein required for colicin V production